MLLIIFWFLFNEFHILIFLQLLAVLILFRHFLLIKLFSPSWRIRAYYMGYKQKFQSSASKHLTNLKKFLKFTGLIRNSMKIVETVTIAIQSTFWPADLPSGEKKSSRYTVAKIELQFQICSCQNGVAFLVLQLLWSHSWHCK